MRIIIVFIFLFFIFVDYAYAIESTVRCPTIETMHQSANTISDAAFVNGSYMAATAPFAIHTVDMGWFAVVYNIQAHSINDAINSARQSMLSVSTQASLFANNLGGIYVCQYDNRKIEVINNDDNWRNKSQPIDTYQNQTYRIIPKIGYN